ncbi:MAG: phosphatidylinositol dimannoside acyltransferase [Chloroflexota bacterium]|jgi:KDO2-lipid IV(A) lauroyltransferase|nr:phosphatidylinositol dimannoside acyltransferase [Chloroflexota bacterium]
MIYWAHRLGAPLSRWVPLWFSYPLAALIGRLAFLLWRDKRENALRNMRIVRGPGASAAEVYRLARASFENYARYMVDMLRLTGVDLTEIDRQLELEGWEHFSDALSAGSGLIFVGGHIGNSDLAAAILASRGFPVSVIAEPLQPPKWDALVQAARKEVGLKVIPLGSSALRFLRVLREKEILAFLIDRPVEEEGVVITFFGQRTRVPGGAAALALRSNSQLLGAYIVRSGRSYKAQISPAIPMPATGDARRDLEALTQAIFDWLEHVIRQHPDQWFMFRPMWPAEP